MAIKTIVVEVSGGVVQEAYADEGIRVLLVNWDEHEEDPTRTCAGELKTFPLEMMPEETEVQVASLR